MLKWLRILVVCAVALLFLSGCITPEKRIDGPGLDWRIRGFGEVLEDWDENVPAARKPVLQPKKELN